MQAFRNRRRRQNVPLKQSTNRAVGPSCVVVGKPLPADVVFGRGPRNPGAELLHHLIRENFEEYESLCRGLKMRLVETIMHCIMDQGGRFLQETEEPGRWLELLHDDVRERISKCFRNYRRSSKLNSVNANVES